MVSTTELLLFSVSTSVETPLAEIVAGVNNFVSVGATGAEVTVRVATAGAALLPLPVANAPDGTVLIYVPAVDAVTITVTVQEPLAGMTPPVRVTAVLPMGAATVPPQVVPAVPLTVRPAGNWLES